MGTEAVPCPRCGSPAGSVCITTGGNVARSPHVVRVWAAYHAGVMEDCPDCGGTGQVCMLGLNGTGGHYELSETCPTCNGYEARPDQWHRPRVENQWENVTVYVGDQAVKPDSCWTHARIKWPDEIRTSALIGWRKRRAQVSDHGNTYWETSDVPTIQVFHHGHAVTIDLAEVPAARLVAVPAGEILLTIDLVAVPVVEQLQRIMDAGGVRATGRPQQYEGVREGDDADVVKRVTWLVNEWATLARVRGSIDEMRESIQALWDRYNLKTATPQDLDRIAGLVGVDTDDDNQS